MSDAKSGFGVVLSRDSNDIAEITNLDGVEVTRNMIDVTSHSSADEFKEYIPGLKDSSEITIEGNFIASDTNGQLGLEDDLDNGTLQSFVITFPTSIGATWTFSAYVTAFKVGGFPLDGQVPFSAKLKIAGKPVLAVTGS